MYILALEMVYILNLKDTKERTGINMMMNTKHLALIGLMAAVLCILGPLALPIGPVPVSLGSLAVYLTVTILGMKKGTVSVVIYILLGLAGLPVFSAFSGGIGKVLGPTGGYIVGYIFLALIYGFFVDRYTNYGLLFLGMILGTFVLYMFGTLWLAYEAGMSFSAALAAGVLPFVVGDLIKMAVAVLAGIQVRRRLWAAGILERQVPVKEGSRFYPG